MIRRVSVRMTKVWLIKHRDDDLGGEEHGVAGLPNLDALGAALADLHQRIARHQEQVHAHLVEVTARNERFPG